MSIEQPDPINTPASFTPDLGGVGQTPKQKLDSLSQESRTEVMSSTTNVSNMQPLTNPKGDETSKKVLFSVLKNQLTRALAQVSELKS